MGMDGGVGVRADTLVKEGDTKEQPLNPEVDRLAFAVDKAR